MSHLQANVDGGKCTLNKDLVKRKETKKDWPNLHKTNLHRTFRKVNFS